MLRWAKIWVVGCCKTTLVKAALTASGAAVQVLTAANLYSSLVGEGEALLRGAFTRYISLPVPISYRDSEPRLQKPDTAVAWRVGLYEGQRHYA